MSAVKISLVLDDDAVALDPHVADLVYNALWDIAFTDRSRGAVSAAVRMRSLGKLQPLRTIRFTGDEAAAVRDALAHVDATEPVGRDR